MKTTLRKGQLTDSGFEILETRELEELEAEGIWALHRKSGAQVFHILNDDRENLFSFAFKTIPEDSSGAPHILEHSVLCGSENFPLKDAFLVLAQGSLQTFLNAWTFPDKTLYPASSVNERDYFNLMDVYGDAVFRPLLSEWTFMQEAHRLVYAEPEGKELQITGVVYNEMKGAYSSLDAYAGLWSVKAVLPGTPYAFESGGDPERIPDLSWEGLKEFHRARYSPANCRVFLAGNIPTEKQLAFLDRKFFSLLEPGVTAPPIARAKRWEKDRVFRVPCPEGEQKSTVFLSFLCGDSADFAETLELVALTETLLGHDGSPLTRRLIDSGLGEDLTPVSGLEGEVRETVFTVGLRGVDAENQKKVEELIMDELGRLAKQGIPKEEIEAALLSMEFSHREIRRSGGPFSLVWMRRALRSWLHEGTPWDSLLFNPAFDQLKKKLAASPRFFENLIQKHFLDNPHRALVILEPEEGFLEKKEAEAAKKLAEKDAAFSEAQRKVLSEKNQDLTRVQEQPDSPEALASIPHLSREDLSPEIEKIHRDYLEASGVPVTGHSLFTNGVSYADLAFPVDNLEPEDYPWLPLFSRAVVSLGLPGMDYGEVSSLLARTAGGLYAVIQTGSPVPRASRAIAFPSGVFDIRGRDWLIYRLKALDEKFGASLDLARSLVTEADFGDSKRIRDLILEMKNELDSSLAPSGHSYAVSRSARNYSRSRGVEERWSGLDQIRFVHKISEMEPEEAGARLLGIRDKLAKAGLVVNLTAGVSSIQAGLGEIGRCFGPLGAPKARARAPVAPEHSTSLKGEVFASPSLQVGFAAITLPSSPYGASCQSAELVLSHLLSTGALWEDIRMKGGAYGAFAQPDLLEGTFSFSTYRDPNPLRSLDSFQSILRNFSGYSSLDKAVIGSYARETRPRTNAEKGRIDFSRLLYGVEDSHRSRRLAALIKTSEKEIAEVLRGLSESSSYPVIIAGEKEAEKAAAALGVTPEILPI